MSVHFQKGLCNILTLTLCRLSGLGRFLSLRGLRRFRGLLRLGRFSSFSRFLSFHRLLSLRRFFRFSRLSSLRGLLSFCRFLSLSRFSGLSRLFGFRRLLWRRLSSRCFSGRGSSRGFRSRSGGGVWLRLGSWRIRLGFRSRSLRGRSGGGFLSSRSWGLRLGLWSWRVCLGFSSRSRSGGRSSSLRFCLCSRGGRGSSGRFRLRWFSGFLGRGLSRNSF